MFPAAYPIAKEREIEGEGGNLSLAKLAPASWCGRLTPYRRSCCPMPRQALSRSRRDVLPLHVTLILACFRTALFDCTGSGYYRSLNASAWSECAGWVEAEPGFWAHGGNKLACPAGRYGSSSGLTSNLCDGACDAGFVCPPASTNRRSHVCGDASVFCPTGSATPTVAFAGFYTVGGDETTRHAQRMCPAGSYCVNGVRRLCPAGRFGEVAGATECSGDCALGFYCPVGSKNSSAISCGVASFYCPVASERPIRTSPGYYAVNVGVGPRAGYGAQAECLMGGWCDAGIRYECPPGRFSNTVAAVDMSTCRACFKGYFCRGLGNTQGDAESCGASTVYCPEGSVTPVSIRQGYYAVYMGHRTVKESHAEKPCPKGYYCVNGLAHACPAGRFGATEQLSRPSCSGPCAAGRYCPDKARIEAYGLACGNVSLFCPINSISPRRIRDGWYTTGGVDDRTRTSDTRCEPGSWCLGGRRYLCPSGTFSRTYGLSSPQDCLAAPAGRYSPAPGAVSPVACGAPSLYCPVDGASEPTLVTAGYYTVGGDGPTTRQGQLVAPAGHYATGGLLFACPAGRYGARRGLFDESCSGRCAPGYYCEPGATSPTWRICGAADKICPKAGSVAPFQVEPGYYTTALDSSSSSDDDLAYQSCPPGRFRIETVRNETVAPWSAVETPAPPHACRLCPEARFRALFETTSCRSCEPGVSATADRTACDCVRASGGALLGDDETLFFNISTGICEAVKSNAVDALIAAYAAKLNETVYTKRHQFPCEPGYWCQHGLRRRCPSGSYGDGRRETRPHCAGLCAAGYYCPEASSSPTEHRCGAVHLYCPAGSSEPKLVDAGFFTADEAGQIETRSSQLPCPRGYFCVEGARRPCAPGRFGSYVAPNYTDALCEGPCAAGYLCSFASTRPDAVKCGGPDRVCPEGSSNPLLVPPGFYSIHTGINADERAALDPHRESCDAYVPCEPGYFCIGGLKQKCPELTYGWRYLLSSPECDGPVAPGCYMPLRALPYHDACPFECGGNDRYCPPLSTHPIAVSPGYYTVGINETRRTAQEACPPGMFCIAGEQRACEAGRYQPEPASESCDLRCPPSAFCPPGSAKPVPCPVGTFSVGHASVCTPCPFDSSRAASSSGHLPRCFHDRICCELY